MGKGCGGVGWVKVVQNKVDGWRGIAKQLKASEIRRGKDAIIKNSETGCDQKVVTMMMVMMMTDTRNQNRSTENQATGNITTLWNYQRRTLQL